MNNQQQNLPFGSTDPDWQAFLQSVGQPSQPRAKRRKNRDKAIERIRQLKAANQQRLRETRHEGP